MQDGNGASRHFVRRAGLALVALHWQTCLAVLVLPTGRDDRLLWSGIACSSDGTTVVGVVGGYRGAAGRIWTSRDAGESWAAGDTVRSWRAVASSADGVRMVAAEDSSDEQKGGFIFTSSDGGSTWSVRTSAGCRHWISVASSADGSRVFAVVGGYTGDCQKSKSFVGSCRGRQTLPSTGRVPQPRCPSRTLTLTLSPTDTI